MYAELIERSWAEQNFDQLVSIAKRLKDSDLRPFPAHLLTYLGIACALKGQHRQALAPLWHAFSKNPQDPNARLNVANCLKDLKDYRSARDLYMGSTHIQQDTLMMLGAAICDMEIGENLEAFKILEKAVAREPNNYSCQYNYGRILFRMERIADSMAAYKKSLELKPTYEPAAQNLAIAAFKAGDVDLAFNMVDQIFKAGRHNEHLLVSVMTVAMEAGQPQLGLYFYELNEKKFSARVDFIAGELARYMKQPERCVELCELTLAQEPGYGAAYIIMAQSLSELGRFAESQSTADKFLTEVDLDALAIEKMPNPWASYALFDDPDLQLKLANRYANHIYNRLPREMVHVGGRKGNPRKIGFMSPDFGNHPVAECMLPVFSSPIQGLEVHAFSLRQHEDEMTQRIRENVHKFYPSFDKSYLDLRTIAEKEGIDTMVDLAVYTAGGRPNYFSLGLAKQQVNFLGYSGTSGSKGYDLIVADDFIIPPGADGMFSEKVIRLSEPLMGCSLHDTRHIKAMDRAEYGLPEGALVFGCLAQHYKYTQKMVEAWSQILKQVPGSLLLLAEPTQGAKALILDVFSSLDVSSDRVRFARREPTREEHIARLKMVDIFLDTFPYNAHSLAADAVSAGVPLLTLSGHSFASRVAGSLMTKLGFGHFVVGTVSEYVALATKLASDGAALKEYRAELDQTIAGRTWGESYAFDFYEKVIGMRGR